MAIGIILVSVAVFCFLYLLFVKNGQKRSTSGKSLPPGPRGLPILGNLHQVGFSNDRLHVSFTKLSKTYGGIFTVKFGSQPYIVVSDMALGKRALIKKGRCFAGRPQGFLGDALMRGSKDIGFQDYTPTWRAQRRIAHYGFVLFNAGMPEFTENIITGEAAELCLRLRKRLDQCQDLYHDVGLAVMNVICAMLLGEKYYINDPEFLDILDYHEKFVHVVGRGQILNAFPFLRYLPLKIVQNLREFVRKRDACLHAKYKEHLLTYKEGKIRDIMDALIKARNEESLLDDDNVIMTAFDMFGAGSETVAVFIRWFIAYMVVHPEVQEKIRQEFEERLGPKQVPRYSDASKLDYFKATFHEVLRIQPVVPLALPHCTVEDTELGGYHIPRNTTVIFNIWAMSRDEKYWKDPEIFDPTRFLDSRGQFHLAEPGVLSFSAGKRACLGEALARKEIFLFLSRLMYNFTFSLPPDAPKPDFAGIYGLNLTPKRFEVILSAR